MSLPTNVDRTTTAYIDHPDGTFLFTGSKSDLVSYGLNQLGTRMTVINVHGMRHSGAQVFCVEKVVTEPEGGIKTTQKWMDSNTYTGQHAALWLSYNMEPNRSFDTGVGLRSPTGAYLGGGNELCARDGTLYMVNIWNRC